MSRRAPAHLLLDDGDRAHFLTRVIQDAWLDADTAQWERRARQLEAARPRPGDFIGQTTLEDRREQWRRLTEAAKACRARATFLHASRQQLDDTIKDIARSAA